MSKAPKLRFKEFSGDWESKCLEELFSFKNGLNKEKEFFNFVQHRSNSWILK